MLITASEVFGHPNLDDAFCPRFPAETPAVELGIPVIRLILTGTVSELSWGRAVPSQLLYTML
jgi:hypothetical protein